MPRLKQDLDAVGLRRAASPRLQAATLAALVLIFGADFVWRSVQLPLPLQALLDEAAHLLTALLLLGALLPALFRAWWLPVGLAAVFIDADHLPAEFGFWGLTDGTPRPYTHSLLAVAVVLLLAALASPGWRQRLLAVAFGLGAHFWRDLATNRIALLWPLTPHGFRIPYVIFAVSLLLSVAIIWFHGRSLYLGVGGVVEDVSGCAGRADAPAGSKGRAPVAGAIRPVADRPRMRSY